MDVQAIKRKRYVYLFASAISFLVLGLVYGWSLFATPLAEIYGWEMSAVKMRTAGKLELVVEEV